MSYSVALLHKEEIARGTMSFVFEKPQGYQFVAGQATDWSLIDPKETDAAGTSRSFSIACAPSDTTLRIATRMRDSAFKRQLKQMAIGDRLQADDPWGEFVLEADATKPVIFLCGGIGITPFLSMIEDAVATASTRPITLFYSNNTAEDVPFGEHIRSLCSNHKTIRLVETMTASTDPTWSGETGFIDWPMIERNASDRQAATFYIAGPPAMVEAMRSMLDKAGVPADRIKLDDFLGY
jgi:ferredoxin-NADP reductase